MPAYFHFSNTPPPFNRHMHRMSFFAHLSLPYSPPSSNNLNSFPARSIRPPCFPYFSDDPNAV
ncbi:hypothetical protein [Neisseria sicca]|uniref:hypothetical protein n=1 Tax=Neisseria sicca TaxID=490 RepID=UPI001F0C69D0|nr:hypothetical protein [Neisseria sicca]